MKLLDWLKTSEIIIGLMAALATAIFWLGRRFGRESAFETAFVSVEKRLQTVEADVEKVQADLSEFRVQLNGLATNKDVSDLRVDVARMAALFEAAANQLDTLYKAALKAGEEARR